MALHELNRPPPGRARKKPYLQKLSLFARPQAAAPIAGPRVGRPSRVNPAVGRPGRVNPAVGRLSRVNPAMRRIVSVPHDYPGKLIPRASGRAEKPYLPEAADFPPPAGPAAAGPAG